MSSNLEKLVELSARMSTVHAWLYAAFLEYARNESDMDFVYAQLKEAADRLEALAKAAGEWRG